MSKRELAGLAQDLAEDARRKAELWNTIATENPAITVAGEIAGIYQTLKDKLDTAVSNKILVDAERLYMYDWHVSNVIGKNFDASVAQYLNGETKVIGFLVGLVMREMEHKGDPKIIRRILIEYLEILQKYPYDAPFSTSKT